MCSEGEWCDQGVERSSPGMCPLQATQGPWCSAWAPNAPPGACREAKDPLCVLHPLMVSSSGFVPCFTIFLVLEMDLSFNGTALHLA